MIKKIADGKYQVRVEVPGPKRRRKYKIAYSYKEAKKIEAELFQRYGLKEIHGKPTIGDLLDRWFRDYKEEIKPTSAETYTAYINQIKGLMGDMVAENVTPAIVHEVFMEYMKKSGNGKGHVTTLKSSLSRAYNHALMLNLVPDNPCSGIRIYGKNNIKPVEVFSKKQVEKIVNNTTGLVNDIAVIALNTGMRIGEILALTWDNVNLQEKTITIRKSLAGSKKGKPIFSTAKTVSSHREIHINSATVLQLRRIKQNQNEAKLFYGPEYKDYNLVICKDDGSAYSKCHPLERVKSALKELGLEGTSHKFRHTHASMLFDKKVNIKIISERLGHKDIYFTLNTYTHLMDGQKDEAKKLIEGLI